MDLGGGAEMLDSPHTFAGIPGPSSHTEEEEDSAPSVHPHFNFELVVFQVEETLFKVIKNGFQVPGTIFEAMFTLPVAGNAPVEGSSLESPIVLEGVDERHFQVFLQALYPFIGQPTVTKYEDWAGVLRLATIWEFTEIREKAIAALSALNPERELTEKISLGAQYRIVDWLRDGYTDLVRKPTLTIEDLRGSPFPVPWEAIAKIFCAKGILLTTLPTSTYSCCGESYYGRSYSNPGYCRCRVVAAVNQVFKADFEAIKDRQIFSEPPLPPPTKTPESKAPSEAETPLVTSAMKKKKKAPFESKTPSEVESPFEAEPPLVTNTKKKKKKKAPFEPKSPFEVESPPETETETPLVTSLKKKKKKKI